MAIKLPELLKIIKSNFVKTVEEGYNKNKFWLSEFDIKGVFYYLLRPTIDQIPEYELYWEWFVKFYEGKKGNPNIDLVLVEPLLSNKKGVETREGYIRIAMEFKWSNMEYKKEFEKRIRKNVKILSKMIKEGSKDYKYGPEANIIRINKGNKPDHAFMFIVDVTEEKEKILGANELYNQLEKDYPKIKIIWAFPNEEKD